MAAGRPPRRGLTAPPPSVRGAALPDGEAAGRNTASIEIPRPVPEVLDLPCRGAPWATRSPSTPCLTGGTGDFRISRLQGRAPEGATGTRIVSDVAGVAADVLLTRLSVALLVRD
ncbi:MAG: hypothetical protein JWP62_3652 [Blastococcus sp.]|nr:hypothetical protein [Blastococcus sp.]